ncbi:hypothetical protein NO995_07645 [Aestuariibaculum sp. M13]|uniref:hypothetical protein n=1 Tax=Aestuariibaculum sp. M13 TaxID=2967132 RepID=UPI002159CC48|nr:hypothetical protein [Aestuariibaculum sp. M13]MCR8667549.1 hypothetical protein [Aestuariibaculum sp. M13]
MKKTIKVIGFLAAIVLSMFLNTNAIESRSEKFNLADAISMISANAECNWWDPGYPNCEPEPYGEVEEPYVDLCYYSLQDPENPMVWYTYSYQGEGITCEDAQTMGPLYCEPKPACDPEDNPIV